MIVDEWQEYMRPYLSMPAELAGHLNDPDNEQERHELYEYIFQNISLGYIHLFYLDPEYPDFWPLFNHAQRQGWPNPDTMHLFTPIDPDGVYRISGYRGTALITDVEQAGGGFFTRGDVSEVSGGMGPTYTSDRIDNFTIGDDDAFSVIYSKERPKDYAGDWRRFDPSATYMLIRQVMYDWVNEEDGKFAIERLDKPTGKPRPTVEELRANIQQLADFTHNYVDVLFNISSRARKRDLEGKFDFVDWSDNTGLNGQKYTVSPFDFAEDEALIIESEIPEKCLYWNFQLVAEGWRAINPLQHQTSINGFQGRIDNDGKFRAVISSTDPGIPNWLDTGGYNRARVYSRWTECNSDPVQTIKKVKLTEIRQHLPADYPVVSPEERDKSFRERRRALQLRKRW